MALHGPASVLDNRSNTIHNSNIVRDRLTRHRSPKSVNRDSICSDDSEDIDIRIPQPYKTSFSAVAAPVRTRRDNRSRSTSPCTSSLKGSRARSKSPKSSKRSNKHVRYDEKVLIRDSDTSDSVTNLSDKDLDNTSGHYSANSSFSSSKMSSDFTDSTLSSQHDYSSELRELSQQIVREYSGITDKENHSPLPSSPKRNQNHVRNSTPLSAGNRGVENGPQKPKEPLSVQNGIDRRRKIIVQEDYDHDRSISYRAAITSNYSEEVKEEADNIMKGYAANSESAAKPERENGRARERRDSSPTEQDPALERSRLTKQKRSISASIGNFFRRLSPHLGRKKKGNISNASSTSLSPSEDADGSFRRHASTNSLSRGKLRRSLMKLMGKGKKSQKNANDTDTSIEDLNQSQNSNPDYSRKNDLYLKSIEKSSNDNVYHRFKEKQTPTRSGSTSNIKPTAMKASPIVASHSDIEAGNSEPRTPERAQPPDSLDVKLVPKSIKSLQASQISTISADDSVGECSLDPNLTGSEPSLLSEGSKQVALSQSDSPSLQSEQIVAETAHNVHAGVDGKYGVADSKYPMPIFTDSVDYLPKDVTPRTPSYLRISSAVSGYGHYSKYSAYKGIEKRSPYSSTLSLRSSRSDLATPQSPTEMPIGKIPNLQPPTNYPPIKNEILSPTVKNTDDVVDSGSITPVVNGANCETSRVNGNHVDSEDVTLNGENGHVENFVATGNPETDADYFLNVSHKEEERLLLLCSKCEVEMNSNTVNEEGCGKMRSAVGKANLLISQKFKQFHELCHQHKHPIPEEKPTLWEDLQGFWEMVKLQVDDVDDMFTEIELMRQNGWREIKIPSRRSSSSSRSSPKSSSLNVSNASTPSHTPGSKRRAARMKDTPESSPERTMKAKMAAKERDDARKKMLAEKRAAMKQQKAQQEAENVAIYVADNNSKSASPARSTESGSEL